MGDAAGGSKTEHQMRKPISCIGNFLWIQLLQDLLKLPCTVVWPLFQFANKVESLSEILPYVPCLWLNWETKNVNKQQQLNAKQTTNATMWLLSKLYQTREYVVIVSPRHSVKICSKLTNICPKYRFWGEQLCLWRGGGGAVHFFTDKFIFCSGNTQPRFTNGTISWLFFCLSSENLPL